MILIVEDNPINVELTENILDHYKLPHATVMNGENAMEWCQNNTADLILMDISLPGIDGLETTKRLRQTSLYRTTPIIALTANAMMGDKNKCLTIGCTDYLSKPFSPQSLLEVIKKYIST